MKKQAFTLVELLVVIVIIGILATISIGTFQGYFAQARNIKITSSVTQYKKALEIYAAQHGEYPVINKDSGTIYYCLGEFPAGDGFDLDQCRNSTDVDPNKFFNNAVLNQAIRDTIGDLPEANYPVEDSNGAITRGILFGRYPATLEPDGIRAYYSLTYILEGIDVDCHLGAYSWETGQLRRAVKNTTADFDGNTFCQHLLTQPENDN